MAAESLSCNPKGLIENQESDDIGNMSTGAKLALLNWGGGGEGGGELFIYCSCSARLIYFEMN